jgi:hypothetical protein
MVRLVHTIVLIAAYLSGTVAAAQSQAAHSSENPVVLLTEAQSMNGFWGDTLKPWHLKANYEIYDANNQVTATGVFEEWWGAPDTWKRSYTGAHFRGTEYRLPRGYVYDGQPTLAYVGDENMGDESVRVSRTPWPESFIAEKLLFPINRPTLNGTPKDQWMRAISSGQLFARFVRPSPAQDDSSCVSPESELSRFEEYYCISDGKLQSSLYHFVTTSYQQYAQFQGRLISREVELSINGHLLLKIRVTDLNEMSVTTDDPFATDLRTQRTPSDCRGGTEFVSDQNPYLDKAPDIYPAIAREKHIHGVVIIAGIIDTDGKIGSLKVLESPDPVLSQRVIRYHQKYNQAEPSLYNGEPVECVYTSATVFRLTR